MGNYESVDFFTDESLIEDPYPYFEHLRSQVPGGGDAALRRAGGVGLRRGDRDLPEHRHVLVVQSRWSVPSPPSPCRSRATTSAAIIDRHRDQLPDERAHGDDGPADAHPGAGIADAAADPEAAQGERGVHAAGRRPAARRVHRRAADCEFISAYAQPFAMLVVADVLGVPEADHQTFRQFFGLATTPGEISVVRPGRRPATTTKAASTCSTRSTTGLPATSRTGDRSRGHDVLTDLALAKYPDGSTPEVAAVVRTATFLFAAGQETTARLLATGLKYLAEYPELQDELRAHRERIPDFIEEALRIESPVKADFRLARRAASVGGVDIAPGTPVMLLNGAANRDPRRFERPAEFRVDRPNAKEHLAFGRGRPFLPGRTLGPGRGPHQHRAHPRPDAGHPAFGGAPRPARRSPLRVRADLGTPRPSRPAHRVHAHGGTEHERPGGRGDRGGVGHRPRRRPSAGRRTAMLWPCSTATAPAAESAAADLSGRGLTRGCLRGRRRRPGRP